ncbi:MAG: cation diffusion facilitator family transporter [Acetobacteraceae bacterium]
MAEGGSKLVIYAALGGNLAIAATKFAAALWTGSSAMLSEAIHSTVDTGNQGLLLYGVRRAAMPPDERHPFGHGMELYFWAFVVSLLVFSLGGAFSLYEGWHRIANPEPVGTVWVNFAVLGASALFEGISFRFAWKEFRRSRGDENLLSGIHRSKDPSVFSVLLEDGAALIGLSFAAIGLGLAVWLDMPALDGAASIAIGALLVLTATFMAYETRSLLTGESASPRVLRHVRSLLENDPRVASVKELLSMHLGPSEILLAITIDFRDNLSGDEVEQAALDLTHRVECDHPEVTRLFLRPHQVRTALSGSGVGS